MSKQRKQKKSTCRFAQVMQTLCTPENEARLAAALKRTKSKKNAEKIFTQKRNKIFEPIFRNEVLSVIKNGADIANFLSKEQILILEIYAICPSGEDNSQESTSELLHTTLLEMIAEEYSNHADMLDFRNETVLQWITMIEL